MFTKLYASLLDWNQVPTAVLIFLILFLIFFLCVLKSRQQQHDPEQTSNQKQSLLSAKFAKRPMPRPPSLPLIGHIHLLRDYQHNPWDGFQAIRSQFGDVVSLKMGIHPMALVSNKEAMREILLDKGDIFSDRPNFPRHHIIFGGDKENSLALCNYSKVHKERRKFCKRGIVPNKFSSRNQLLETIISKLVVNFVDNIDKLKPTKVIEIQSTVTENHQTGNVESTTTNAQINSHKLYYTTTKEHLLFLTSDIFMDFLCGESYSHSDPEYKEFVQGCDFVFWDINQSYLIDFLPFLTNLGLGYFYLKKLKRITDFLRDFIDEKIFEPRLQHHSKSENKYAGTGFMDMDDGCGDYLDSIILEYLAEGTSMSLADYKVGFADLLAGHAAVSNMLIRLLGHLALDDDVQNMICEEAEQTDVYNSNHKPYLPVTEAALNEALRIASSPIVPHVAREDTSIGEFQVPQGTMVLFNNYHLNLSEHLWTNPLEFDPTRFLETCEGSGGLKKFKLNIPKHFIPFSVGMRQCLGYKMVETTTIVLIANLCRKFIIKANDENLVRRLLTPKGSVALDPDSECFELRLYPR